MRQKEALQQMALSFLPRPCILPSTHRYASTPSRSKRPVAAQKQEQREEGLAKTRSHTHSRIDADEVPDQD